MAHFDNEALGLSFDLPDEPNALEIIKYDSKRLEMYGEPALVILWECIKPLILNWDCEHLPDYKVNLEKVKSLKAAQAVEFAAMRGVDWRASLDEVPKNS